MPMMCPLWRSGSAVLGPLVQAAAVGFLIAVAADAAASGPMVDPEVRQQVSAGRSRVIVELRVESPQDPGAIAAAQERVLAALPEGHAALSRRYTSVPMLALDVDAEGLRALERLTDAIVRVRADAVKRPQ